LDGADFVVRYHAGPVSRSYAVEGVESSWEKRSHDGFAALERCFEHLQWFTGYRSTSQEPAT
jgi:hypothetical protein